jgi:hypothetical protein
VSLGSDKGVDVAQQFMASTGAWSSSLFVSHSGEEGRLAKAQVPMCFGRWCSTRFAANKTRKRGQGDAPGQVGENRREGRSLGSPGHRIGAGASAGLRCSDERFCSGLSMVSGESKRG